MPDLEPIEVNDLHTVGAVADRPGYMLPPEAWTIAHNVRWADDAAVKMTGHAQIFGTPVTPPHFAIPVRTSTQSFVVYVSLTKAGVWDGATHTDITRASADFNANDTRDWNGTTLGGIPILNNGTDVPQYWANYSLGTPLDDLLAWPPTWRCRAIRAMGPHLIAIGITKAGDDFPHMVINSHPAEPGHVPISWDVTDGSKDARENELPDVDSGILMTLLPLRGQMYLYKEAATWRMNFIGGRFQFAYDTFLETIGSLTKRGACSVGDGQRHAVWGQDDIVVHNGQEAESILDRRWKRALFNAIDPANYLNSFCFCSPDVKEVWFCYPENGLVNPNRALVWNYQYNTLSTADVAYRNAFVGTVELSDPAIWDPDTNAWDTDGTPWNKSSRRKTVVLDTDHNKFHQFNETEQRDGQNFVATLQRMGLALVGKKRTGEPIVDIYNRKFLNKLWIKAAGGPIGVRVGFQELVEGPVTWKEQKFFDPLALQEFLDFVGSGRAIAIEFQTNTNVGWKLEGYRPNISRSGNY